MKKWLWWQIALIGGVLVGTFLFHRFGRTETTSGLLSVVPWHSHRPASAYKSFLTRFRDVAKEAGLNYRYRFDKRPLTVLSTIGNGCAFLDYDNDGNLDILLVSRRPALFRGDGKGKFARAPEDAGLAALPADRYLGCAVGDFDNDGFSDLYLSGWRTGRLIKNDGGRRFRDITKGSGLRPHPWGSSCGFADLDGDGFLDLYVAGYVNFGPESKPQHCEFTVKDETLYSACGPTAYKPVKGVLYKNLAGRGFRNVTAEWGADTHHGAGLAVAFADFDNSGNVGFAVANDDRPGDLFQNAGGGRLKNIGEESGTAYEPGGDVHGGMGADWGDYDNDGDLDLFVSTFRDEFKSLYRNEGDAVFSDESERTGIHEKAWPYVAFGCKLFDADNDGWLDLMIANGHIKDYVDLFDATSLRQPTQFFHNQGGTPHRFEEVSADISDDLERPIVGRGLAVGDYDNDGRMDALVIDNEGPPLLLHNESAVPKRGWVGFRVIGGEGMNRSGYGAVITVRSGTDRWVRQCQPGGSYLSSSDHRVHFGLSASRDIVESVTVRWPGGKTETWRHVPAGRYLTLRPGSPPE